jgi:hypothetical protein
MYLIGKLGNMGFKLNFKMKVKEFFIIFYNFLQIILLLDGKNHNGTFLPEVAEVITFY